jgi:hypothetical protein
MGVRSGKEFPLRLIQVLAAEQSRESRLTLYTNSPRKLTHLLAPSTSCTHTNIYYEICERVISLRCVRVYLQAIDGARIGAFEWNNLDNRHIMHCERLYCAVGFSSYCCLGPDTKKWSNSPCSSRRLFARETLPSCRRREGGMNGLCAALSDSVRII